MRRRVFPACLVLSIFLSPLLAWIDDEPEEPDYFFLTGGPYTQKRGSPQIIWANQWAWSGEGPGRLREYTGAGRFEIGLTDRWEADFEFGAVNLRQGGDGQSGVADFLAGARYRLLDESFAPFALTLGPQVVLPTASVERGLGNGEPGYALDVAAAKDWGGPVFLAASLNVLWTPNVPSGVGPTAQDVDLTDIGAAMALAWRALERSTNGGVHHDIHIFLETGWDQTEAPEDGSATRTSFWLLSPGFRYGFTSAGGALTEIGVALPVGINRSAPDWGWIIQAQFELPSLR